MPAFSTKLGLAPWRALAATLPKASLQLMWVLQNDDAPRRLQRRRRQPGAQADGLGAAAIAGGEGQRGGGSAGAGAGAAAADRVMAARPELAASDCTQAAQHEAGCLGGWNRRAGCFGGLLTCSARSPASGPGL